MKIVLATNNEDKCTEMSAILSEMPIILLTLNEFPEIGEIIEDGQSLEENALIKANHVHKLTDLPTIADDTGLEVEALNGAPGIYSARYAGENCSYFDNVNKLLQEMKNIPSEKRSAIFKTSIAYVDDNMELTSEGIVQGTVTRTKKGVAGFGYDPIFYVPDLEKTFAEMKIEEKNLVSHRSRAIKALKADLATYFNASNIKENA